MGAYPYGRYYRNRMCPCPRCRCRSANGAIWLVTLGILFLLDTMGVIRFHYTWPVLLIMGGSLQVLYHSLSDEGHIQPGIYPAPPPAPGAPPIPPPASSSGQGASHV